MPFGHHELVDMVIARQLERAGGDRALARRRALVRARAADTEPETRFWREVAARLGARPNPLGRPELLALGGALLALGAVLLYKSIMDAEAADTTPPSGPLLPPGGRVRLVGDSIGVGLAPQLAKMLEAQGYGFSARVKVGETITGLRNKVDASDADADLVLVSLGSNDAAFANPRMEEPKLAELLQVLRSKGARVVLVMPPSFVGDLNARQAAVLDMFGAAVVPSVAIEGNLPSVASDPMRLHPTPSGYAAYAAQIAEALTRT